MDLSNYHDSSSPPLVALRDRHVRSTAESGRDKGWGYVMPTEQRKSTLIRAKKMRKTMTEGEKRLWSELKIWRTSRGIHWRKQAAIGPYVADFLCHSKQLVIELDDEFHFTSDGMARDIKRDNWLNSQGYEVIRIITGELSDNFDGCIETILRQVGET